MVSRRSFIQGAGVGLFASLSGCSALGSGAPSQTTISEIYVDNYHNEPHTIHLLIFDQEADEPMEPVYLRSRTFEANDPSEKFQTGGGQFEELPKDPKSYHIEVRLDEREWDSVDVNSYDDLPDQISIGVSIGYQRKESGPPAWKVTISEMKEDQDTIDSEI